MNLTRSKKTTVSIFDPSDFDGIIGKFGSIAAKRRGKQRCGATLTNAGWITFAI
jgi:hypothetical protein